VRIKRKLEIEHSSKTNNKNKVVPILINPKNHAGKVYWGRDVKLHEFLTSDLQICRRGNDQKEKISFFFWELNSDTSAFNSYPLSPCLLPKILNHKLNSHSIF
jgi:hypothetical protein